MKDVLLIGAVAAHLQVLDTASRQPFVAARLTLVYPYATTVFAPRVTDVIAGVEAADAAEFSMADLAKRARARFIEARVVALDAVRRSVTLADGRELRYDVLSLDAAGMESSERLPGAQAHALPYRPIEAFLPRWDEVVQRSTRQVVNALVLGGSLDACAVALAVAHRLGARGRVTIVTGREGLDGGSALRGRLARRLKRHGVTVIHDEVQQITHEHVHIASGARVVCDVPVLVQAAEPPPWLHGSALALDETGRVLIGGQLACLSHPEVFAVGALATRERELTGGRVPSYASGHLLAANLRRASAGGDLLAERGRNRRMGLMTMGPRRALWRGLGLNWIGLLPWWWLQARDARWLKRLRGHAQETPPISTAKPSQHGTKLD